MKCCAQNCDDQADKEGRFYGMCAYCWSLMEEHERKAIRDAIDWKAAKEIHEHHTHETHQHVTEEHHHKTEVLNPPQSRIVTTLIAALTSGIVTALVELAIWKWRHR